MSEWNNDSLGTNHFSVKHNLGFSTRIDFTKSFFRFPTSQARPKVPSRFWKGGITPYSSRRFCCIKIIPERNRCWKYACICWIQYRYFECEGNSRISFFSTVLMWLFSYSSTLRTRVNRVQTLVTGRALGICLRNAKNNSNGVHNSSPFPFDRIRPYVQPCFSKLFLAETLAGSINQFKQVLIKPKL